MSSTNFNVLNKSTEENSIVFEKSGKKNEAFFKEKGYLKMAHIIILICSILIFLVVKKHDAFPYDSNPIVETAYGPVKGVVMLSKGNRGFFSFKGLPYAAPPVGELRFKDPQPPQNWSEIRDASEHGPICLQKDYLFEKNPEVIGSEDCLYLNVYTPMLPISQNYLQLLPVMVWFHYGGFFMGSGNQDTNGPEYFMDKDVVVVTLNYRLGALGFLSTGDDSASGNWALKDQRAALRWVQQNIINFGGDPHRVTIFGQSAGGASVHHHILSPSAKGLFQAAISESGSAFSLWALPQAGNAIQKTVTNIQAQFVGCNPNTTSSKLIECLRKVDGETLVASGDHFKYLDIEPTTIFAPVIEAQTENNPDPFISQPIFNVIKEKKFNQVPWISGLVENEGILRASPLLRNSNTSTILIQSLNHLGPMIFGLSASVLPDKIEETWKKIVDFYLHGSNIDVNDEESVQGFVDLFGDRAFIYPSYQATLAHLLYGHAPLWFYNFNYKGLQSFEEKFARTSEEITFDWGVSHCDELLYLFRAKKFFDDLQGTDEAMSLILIEMWTNFATYGLPTPQGLDNYVDWLPLKKRCGKRKYVKNEDLKFLDISGCFNDGINMEIKTGFKSDRMHFWENLNLTESFPNVK